MTPDHGLETPENTRDSNFCNSYSNEGPGIRLPLRVVIAVRESNNPGPPSVVLRVVLEVLYVPVTSKANDQTNLRKFSRFIASSYLVRTSTIK